MRHVKVTRFSLSTSTLSADSLVLLDNGFYISDLIRSVIRCVQSWQVLHTAQVNCICIVKQRHIRFQYEKRHKNFSRSALFDTSKNPQKFAG